MSSKRLRTSSPADAAAEAAATREALLQGEAGQLMTLTPEMMDHIAETGEVPEFVRDPE